MGLLLADATLAKVPLTVLSLASATLTTNGLRLVFNWKEAARLMQDFIALDFETANNSRASACEISLVHFKNGEPTKTLTSLLRPPKGFDEFIHTPIHGISASDCRDAPSLSDFLPEITDFIGDKPAVCHNSGFDFSVLRETLSVLSAPPPFLRYGCTLALSRSAFRDDLAIVSYALPRVCWHLDIPFEETHRAEADALASGSIAVKLLASKGCKTLDDLANSLGVSLGKLGPGIDERCCGAGTRRRSPEPIPAEIAKVHAKVLGVESLDPGGEFHGKSVVITGTLQSMTRQQAEALLEAVGAQVSNSVSKKTDYLIEGKQDVTKLKADGVSGKHRKCMELKAKGVEIEVLDEQMFLENLCD